MIINEKAFKQAVAAANITMAELSGRLFVTRQYISALAHGKPCSQEWARNIARELGVSVASITKERN